jgi:dsDNA-binding SOS-regulon protein
MGGMGGFGGGMMPGGDMGGFGGGMPGMGGMGGMMGGRTGQLQRTIDSLKADTPRDEALKKIEAKDKDAYAKIKKALDDANAQLAELAKKAEVELPDTTEQQKAKTLEFLAKEKDAIDKLLETDKTDSATAMRSFNELAQKNKITINPAGMGGRGAAMGGFGGGMPGMGGAAAQPPAGRGAQGAARGNTNVIRQIEEKFPEEFKEAQKLRESDPAAYRDKLRELQRKLNAAD